MTALEARKNWLRTKTAPKQTMTAMSGSNLRGEPLAAAGGFSLASASIPQPGERAHDHHGPGRHLPEDQQHEGREAEREVGRRADAVNPDRVVEGGAEQAHHRRVHPQHRALRVGEALQPLPEGQRADHQQERGREDRSQAEQPAQHAARTDARDRAQVGCEGEERPRHGLGGAVARDEGLVRDPAGRHHLRLQQRQQDVPAAEDQRGRAVEAVHQLERLRRPGGGKDRERCKQGEEQREQQDGEAPVHGDPERRIAGVRGPDAGRAGPPARRRR